MTKGAKDDVEVHDIVEIYVEMLDERWKALRAEAEEFRLKLARFKEDLEMLRPGKKPG